MSYGEKQNGREIIDKVTRKLVDEGLPVDWAKRKAREARIRNEQREDGTRK